MARPGLFKADLPELAQHLLEVGPRKVATTSRRIRVILNHTVIVDTTRAVHVWEHDWYPQYYVPLEKLQNCSWKDKTEIKESTSVAHAAAVVQLTVDARGGREFTTDRVLRFSGPGKVGESLAGLVRLEFGSMDQWLEEDVPIYVHPKDPFKRIDTLPSSRTIEVRIQGKTVAQTSSAVHLLETGLPTRYYLPLTAVDQSVLRRSNLVTSCPYKGDAEYYHVVIDGQEHSNQVWYYRQPTHESSRIAGLVCFYNEKVDILLDGELQERPCTHFG